ncbi:aminodeoxychorismate/anthranilate synthase component II [Spirosoma sp. BT702]|uniref:Aminodeoxychorismate/anthranilate synthase component II n=1 Tax=Spirosoma profusum TaxID=2771354 RepID=A0A926XVR2_9BACT|nr:aminodeoxychorismate/anthranilate synthase component II [Spirosoma profusum]MBD2701274.1 aminodeoxychorismate/anthranilate synthase component II [Spirosoma profusum]
MDLLVIDNFDSFTYMLVDYLQQAGARCHVVRNNESLVQLSKKAVDGVVLSPGPGIPRRAGRLMEIIAHYHHRLPILGICLGHQAIGEFFGARLVRARQPMHGKISTICTMADDVLWKNIPTEFDVTRYHSLILTDLSDTYQPSTGIMKPLVCTALSKEGEVMALRHRTLPLWGIQFHPEAHLTQYGLQLIQNWIDFIGFSTKKNDSILSLTTSYI